MGIVSRFAPSPTGSLHIGGLRTAIFAWFFAKTYDGECLIRFEDTDRQRSKVEYTQSILESFLWMGIEFDRDPFFQSQAQNRHLQIVKKLLKEGKAYYCNCSNERLKGLREGQQRAGIKPKYDGKCRELNLDKGSKQVVRFKNPQSGMVNFKDLVRGSISISNDELDDLILVREDGTPTYNLSVVVDDLDMGITHVIRGEDHINNTPRQINIFKAIGAQLPEYGHVPMILGEDKKRMSKRHGSVGVLEFREMGILPEALLNYLVRLGWSLGDAEFFTLEELVENFQKGKLNNSPAIFSLDKLYWYNREYLSRYKLTDLLTKLSKLDKHFSADHKYSLDVLNLIKDRCSTLVDFTLESQYFFEDTNDFDSNLSRKIFTKEGLEVLVHLNSYIETIEDWNAENIHHAMNSVIEGLKINMSKIGQPFRLAITGTMNSPSIDKIAEILGKETVIFRLDRVIKEFS